MNFKTNAIVIVAASLFITGCSVNVNEDSQETTVEAEERLLLSEMVEGDPLTTEATIQIEANKQEVSSDKIVIPTIVEEGTIVNPDNIMAVVNKEYALPGSYSPQDLVIPNIPFYFDEDLPKKYLREEAAVAIEKLFHQAKEDGIPLLAASGYRSFDRQQAIFNAKVASVGEEEANQVVAYPGESEHQTGLAMDVTTAEQNYQLEEEFGETVEGIWLKENVHKYGFIIRYPQGKEQITGYQYEPWHIRYVGEEVAKVIHENDITLEEYVEMYGSIQVNRQIDTPTKG